MGQRKEQRFGSLLPGERRARTTWLSANCEHGAAGDTLRSVPDFISAPSRWSLSYRSSDVWVLDLEQWAWSKPSISGPSPHPRGGQSQVPRSS